MSEKMRLQKFLAHCGVASRRKAEDFIAAGRVVVNGKKITEFGVQIDPAVDTVTVDGKPLKTERPGVLLLNKPKNVITTRSDTHDRKTVAQFLPPEFESYFPVGRLDQNTTGLLIMTNDGDFADILLHPRYEIPRTYVTEVQGLVSPGTIKKIENGFSLEDGPVRAAVSVRKRAATTTTLELTLTIGRKRVVRRMMKSLGHRVVTLERISHGPFSLGKLPPGAFRILADGEFRRIKRSLLGQKRPG